MFTFSALQRITGGKLGCITSNLNLTTARSKMKLVVMVMNKNNNRYLAYLFNKRSRQVLYPCRYKNRKHLSVEGNKICKLMIRQSEKRRESVHLIIFICSRHTAFSHTAFRLSIFAVVYVSSNYHFIILMPNVSSHTGVGWEKRQIHSKEKGRETFKCLCEL